LIAPPFWKPCGPAPVALVAVSVCFAFKIQSFSGSAGLLLGLSLSRGL